MSNISYKYILITPAKNEAKYIEQTIQSVCKQTVKPQAWIIVNDGSTDNTADIISGYLKKNQFIHLINLPVQQKRHFSGKVNAIDQGFILVDELNINYDYYGNLDADVSFDENYYEALLAKMMQEEEVGVAGGHVYDLTKSGFIPQLNISYESVAGPVQLFRKECYRDIGGYVASELGLVDAIAEVKARMKGWATKTFPDLVVYHLRATGSESNTPLQIARKDGKKEYLFGYHPLFHIARSMQRLPCSPIVLGSLVRSFYFFKCYFDSTQRPVNKEFVKYLRSEEMRKLKYFLNPVNIFKCDSLSHYLKLYSP